jgi:hypothetical protein
MGEWWTYRISDFLMVAPATYWRQVELHNTQHGPGPWLAACAGVAVAIAFWRSRPRDERLALAALGVGWAWIGWAFYAQRLADIHLAAPWLAAACGVQAVLLGIASAWPASAPPERLCRVRRFALGAGTLVVLAYPWIGVLAGRPWVQSEVAGWMPDPTAWSTLAWIVALTHRPRWQRGVLVVLPIAFVLAGLLHHATMAR